MVFNVPFNIDFASTNGTTPVGTCGVMCFRVNSIAVSNFTDVAASGGLNIEAFAMGSSIRMFANGSQTMSFQHPPMGISDYEGVLSNNYMHMGNMYRNYRVLGQSCRLSGLGLTPTSGAAALPQLQTLIWTQAGTDDLEAGDTFGSAEHWCRPFNRMHRYQKTKTYIRDGFELPKSMKFGFSVRKLVKDRLANTSVDYVGSCEASPTPGTAFPTYNFPAKHVYHVLVFQPYGGWGASPSTALPVGTAFAGYLTVTKRVQFFNPHDNYDFYDAV